MLKAYELTDDALNVNFDSFINKGLSLSHFFHSSLVYSILVIF